VAARESKQEEAGGDVYDVVPAVDFEDDQVLAVEGAAVAPGGGVELGLGQETKQADEHERGADDDAEPLGG
jgi:hypothetical protein